MLVSITVASSSYAFSVGSIKIPSTSVVDRFQYKVESAPRDTVTPEIVNGVVITNEEKISILCGSVITSEEFENCSYSELESKLLSLQKESLEYITVNVWKWKYPGIQNNFEKVSSTITISVNKNIADLYKGALDDIYNHSDKPVLEYSGSYNVRSKNNYAGSVTASIHAYGAAIDFNTSDAELVNSAGELLSNWNYGSRVRATKESWDKLPECQTKYNILHEESSVVKIFESYGFEWGGNWSDKYMDGMHFQWVSG